MASDARANTVQAVGKFKVKKKKHGFGYELKHNWILFLMLIPAFIFFIINNYIPMFGVYFAFVRYTFAPNILLSLIRSPFVGLANFRFLWQSGTLVSLTVKTVLYNIVFIFLGNALQIMMGILLSQMLGKYYKKIAQSLMFLPYFVSMVIVAVLAYNIFNYEFGMLNSLIKSAGGQPVNIYGDPNAFPFIIVFFNIWKGIGYGTVIYLAAILGINKEIYEAADVDGCNIFQRVRYIILPNLKPMFIILVLFSIGGILKGQFDLFYQLVGNNGLLFSTTDIIDTYVYRSLTTTFDPGLGAAAGVYQSVFGFILILVVNWLVKRRNPDYVLF